MFCLLKLNSHFFDISLWLKHWNVLIKQWIIKKENPLVFSYDCQSLLVMMKLRAISPTYAWQRILFIKSCLLYTHWIHIIRPKKTPTFYLSEIKVFITLVVNWFLVRLITVCPISCWGYKENTGPIQIHSPQDVPNFIGKKKADKKSSLNHPFFSFLPVNELFMTKKTLV